jgi:hypothetical protein
LVHGSAGAEPLQQHDAAAAESTTPPAVEMRNRPSVPIWLYGPAAVMPLHISDFVALVA